MNSAKGPDHINNSESTITITGSYSYTWWDRVTGSTNSAPPWTADFDELYDNNHTIMQNYSKSLGARKGGHVYDKLEVDEGAETWSQSPDVCTRNLIRYDFVQQQYLHTWDVGEGGNPG
ncbi:MAG TPA: hypothetical protein PLH94_08640 [Fimbriimonadaceae bacterium]|nr:hypothetical protein [Fimbriimonadaceae bacterium]